MDNNTYFYGGLAVSLYLGYHAFKLYREARKSKLDSKGLERELEQERELNRLLRRKDKKAYFALVYQIKQAKSSKQSQNILSYI